MSSSAGISGPRATALRSVRAARRLEQVKTYVWFADGQIRAEYRRDERGHVVLLHDMRYAPQPDSVESLWPVRVTFESEGSVVGVERLRSRKRRGGLSELITDVWGEITNP